MTPSRRIDHLVLAVRDLDAAASRYEQLGFLVGTRNVHPWGTENRLVQFASSFLELITVGDAAEIPSHSPGVFSFGAFVRDYLAQREGLAMLVLDSQDAVADAAAFAERGIGPYEPFSFERAGRRRDGTPTQVGFSLAFARDDRLPDAGFFVCQQRAAEAFWDPELQQHPNGAVDVSHVTLEVADPAEHTEFLRVFTGGDLGDDGQYFRLAQRGRLQVQPNPSAGRFTGFSVATTDPGGTEARLRDLDVGDESSTGSSVDVFGTIVTLTRRGSTRQLPCGSAISSTGSRSERSG